MSPLLAQPWRHPSKASRCSSEYPIAGDGALLAFRRGEVVVLLLVENLDGRALDDARDYATLLDARIQREAASAGR